MLGADATGHLQPCSSSPPPEGQCTPTFPLSNSYYPACIPAVPYTGYTAVTIPPAPGPTQPPLPEKRRLSALPASSDSRFSTLRTSCSTSGAQPPTSGAPHHVTFSPSVGEVAPPAGAADGLSVSTSEAENRVSVKFVQDSSRFWYKPGISRDQGNRRKAGQRQIMSACACAWIMSILYD